MKTLQRYTIIPTSTSLFLARCHFLQLVANSCNLSLRFPPKCLSVSAFFRTFVLVIIIIITTNIHSDDQTKNHPSGPWPHGTGASLFPRHHPACRLAQAQIPARRLPSDSPPCCFTTVVSSCLPRSRPSTPPLVRHDFS